jgi:hypothetical protein
LTSVKFPVWRNDIKKDATGMTEFLCINNHYPDFGSTKLTRLAATYSHIYLMQILVQSSKRFLKNFQMQDLRFFKSLI